MCDPAVLSQMGKDLEVIKSHVIGNGTPGLVKRVGNIEAQLSEGRGRLALLVLLVPPITAAVVKLIS